MCAAPVSTHTAVRAGRHCQEGTSALSVSSIPFESNTTGGDDNKLAWEISVYVILGSRFEICTFSFPLQQFVGIRVVMASAPDPTCVPVQAVSFLPAVEQEQEVSTSPTYCDKH